MALSRDVVIRLVGDSASAVKAQQEAARAAEVTVQQYRKAERDYARQQQAMETTARKQQQAMADVGKGAMVMGAVVAAGLGLSVKAAIDWESAWAGVMKTVDGSPQQMAALEKELRNLATTLPATHEEIAGVAEAAGQLGIKRQDIADFTKVAIAMGVSTNLSAEEAATGLAQMMNVMGTASGDIDRMGSTLVALGNAGASTEADILSMSQRLAGAGKLIGASESDVMALASAMADMGIQSELGGGAMSRVLLKIYSAMQTGGEEAQKFADVAGVSATEFAAKWRSSPVEATDMLVQGLGRVKDEGGNVVQTLGDLGIEGTQNLQVMLSLAGAGDHLTNSLATGNKAWAENTALMNEANQRYDTAASKIQIARNQINDAAIDIGGTLMPVVAKGAELIGDFARGFEMLPGPAKEVVTIIGAVGSVIAISGGAAIVAVPKIVAFRVAMQTLSTSSSMAARGVSRLGMVMTGPWGIAITAAVTLIGALVTSLGASSRASESAAAYQKDLASALRDTNGVIDENIRALAAQKAADEQVGENSNLLKVADEAGISLPRLTDALLGNRDALNEVDAALKRYVEDHTTMVTSGDTVSFTLDEQGEAAKGARAALVDLAGSMGGAVAENERLAAGAKESGQAVDGQATAQQGLLAELNATAGSAAGAAGGMAGVGSAADATTDQVDEATEAIKDWRGELQKVAADFVEPLSAYKALLSEKTEAEQKAAEKTAAATKDSSDSWSDYVDDVDVSLTELADRLQEQIETQQHWRKNIVTISQRGGDEVAQAIAAMGEEGVDLAAKMAKGSDKEFQRMARMLLKDVQVGGDQWTASMDTDMRVMAAIGKNGAKMTAAAVAKQLGIGASDVAAIARRYGVNLASGINPLLHALGKPSVQGYNTGGGYAQGGYITGPGGPTSDSIPARLSNGEYVIQAKAVQKIGKDRLDELNQGRLPESPGFATGGYVSTKDVPGPPSLSPYRGLLAAPGNAVTKEMYDEVVGYVKKMGAGGPGVQNALRWARTQVGKPYIWGGVGPAGYDCSGFMSAITNVIKGKSPYSRLGSTASFPWSGFASGIAGGFSVGSTRDAGGGIGHMAGKLGGVNVESYGGHGPAVGGGARGADDSLFNTRAHLVGSYQTGTPYVPRDGLAYLHQGERVVPAEQNRQYAMPITGAASVRALAVQVNIEGARLVGTLDLGDGLQGRVEGILADAFTSVTDRGRYNP